MESIDTIKYTLDLREGWKHIEQKDVISIINNKNKGNYWRFNEDKTLIITLKDGKLGNYRINETKVLFAEDSKEISHINQKVKSETMIDLSLSPENEVRNSREAFEKARYSDKKRFRFISKGNYNKAVIVLDFSEGKRPKRTVYPLDKYNIKMNVVEI